MLKLAESNRTTGHKGKASGRTPLRGRKGLTTDRRRRKASSTEKKKPKWGWGKGGRSAWQAEKKTAPRKRGGPCPTSTPKKKKKKVGRGGKRDDPF